MTYKEPQNHQPGAVYRTEDNGDKSEWSIYNRGRADQAEQQSRALIDARELLADVETWRDMSAAEMRLRCGEMTSQEIRTVRAILNQILPSNVKDERALKKD